jgi:hypothetical protein
MSNNKHKRKQTVVDGKRWVNSWQGWSWVITIVWMTTANFWHPFGLYGLVCMFTPIVIALSGRGKMSCARICPRGSFIGLFARPFVFIKLNKPELFGKKGFKFFLWAVMMGSFVGLMIWIVPKRDVALVGYTILIFMEVATGFALLTGILFTPRSWCTFCPMGFTTENIRNFQRKKKALRQIGKDAVPKSQKGLP